MVFFSNQNITFDVVFSISFQEPTTLMYLLFEKKRTVIKVIPLLLFWRPVYVSSS